jgi:hypothetical protein
VFLQIHVQYPVPRDSEAICRTIIALGTLLVGKLLLRSTRPHGTGPRPSEASLALGASLSINLPSYLKVYRWVKECQIKMVYPKVLVVDGGCRTASHYL